MHNLYAIQLPVYHTVMPRRKMRVEKIVGKEENGGY